MQFVDPPFYLISFFFKQFACVQASLQAIDFVRERLLAGKSPRQIAEEMCDRCLAPDTSGCGKVRIWVGFEGLG